MHGWAGGVGTRSGDARLDVARPPLGSASNAVIEPDASLNVKDNAYVVYVLLCSM